MKHQVPRPEVHFHPRFALTDDRPDEAEGTADGGWHDGAEPLADGLKMRLTELTEWAITSRSLARQYFRTAHRFITAARQARCSSDQSYYRAHLEEARKAREQARKCISFSRLCHNRAECLAIIADCRPKGGT